MILFTRKTTIFNFYPQKLIHDYIEYYDTEHIQEKLNYLSPIEYKKQVA
ncbi:IS3 family transposase [Bacillus toyonensis]